MGSTYITDITDFEGLPARLARGPAGRLARYFGSIVSAGSVLGIGTWADVAIRCRRRPGRKSCPGHIRVYRRGHFNAIEWHCTSCDDQGIISNWRNSAWDLSPNEAKQNGPRKLAEVVVSEEELRELRKIVLDTVNRRVIDEATVTPGGFALRGNEDNFEDLLDYVSDEAYYEPDLRRCDILSNVYDKIEVLVLECLSEESDLQAE